MISLKGSTLSIKGLGTARIEIIILCILLGMFICCNVFCSSCKFKILGEGFGTKLSELNNGSLKGKVLHNPNSTYEKVQIPLPEGQLFYYANNEFKPECCKNSSVSGTGGCACETEEQVKFLESRGGNKTYDIKEL